MFTTFRAVYAGRVRPTPLPLSVRTTAAVPRSPLDAGSMRRRPSRRPHHAATTRMDSLVNRHRSSNHRSAARFVIHDSGYFAYHHRRAQLKSRVILRGRRQASACQSKCCYFVQYASSRCKKGAHPRQPPDPAPSENQM